MWRAGPGLIVSLDPTHLPERAADTITSLFLPRSKAIYDSPEMKQLVEDFNSLPAPKSREDDLRSSYFWTLQYPFSHYTTEPDNIEDMEFVLSSMAMLHPVVVPCKRSLLQLEDVSLSPYIIGLFCQAFVGEKGKKLLEWDMANLEQRSPEEVLDLEHAVKHGKTSAANDKAVSKAIQSTLPAGYIPNPMHAFMHKREGVSASDLPIKQVVRPTSIVCRDMRLIHALMFQTALVGIDIEMSPTDMSDYSAFYVPGRTAAGEAVKRRDAAFCVAVGCTALSDTLKRCSACRITSYCSAEHQKQDWPRHKSRCRDTQKLFKEQQQQGSSGAQVDFGDKLSVVYTSGRERK